MRHASSLEHKSLEGLTPPVERAGLSASASSLSKHAEAMQSSLGGCDYDQGT